MLLKLQKLIEENHLIAPGDNLVVGVSGGADSVCLLLLLYELSDKLSFSISVMHVNHMLREKPAKKDEAFVVDLCKDLGVPVYVEHKDVSGYAKEHAMSIEEAGRFLRYQAFGRLAQKLSAKVCVAHHRDDEDETMLLHLFRGSGLHGLTGTKLCSLLSFGDVSLTVFRPFLFFSKQEILEELKKREQKYQTDETNLLTDTTRNKLRLKVLPYVKKEICESASNSLLRTRQTLGQIEAFLEESAALFLSDEAHFYQRDEVCYLEVSSFLNCHEGLRPVILRKVLECALKKDAADFFYVHYMQILDLCKKQSGRQIDLPHKLICKRDFCHLCFMKKDTDITRGPVPGIFTISDTSLTVADAEENFSFFEKNMKSFSSSIYTKWIDCDKIKEVLTLRTRKKGDYLVINKEGQRKKLKDYMVEQKIPKDLRDTWPVVADGDEIVWIIGYRLSYTYYVTEKTKKIQKLIVHRLQEDAQGCEEDLR